MSNFALFLCHSVLQFELEQQIVLDSQCDIRDQKDSNFYPRTGDEGTEEEQRYSSSLLSSWSTSRLTRFTPVKDTRYPLY